LACNIEVHPIPEGSFAARYGGTKFIACIDGRNAQGRKPRLDRNESIARAITNL
jgi:GGDEF domain-containing protein